MFKAGCINPNIMGALSRCGHGDRVLISDGNYPAESKTPEAAVKVFLGLSAGVPTVTQVLETLLQEVNVEAAAVMVPDDNSTPPIFAEFKELLSLDELAPLSRNDFYSDCQNPDVRLAISTGEQRVYANILLTIGVAK